MIKVFANLQEALSNRKPPVADAMEVGSAFTAMVAENLGLPSQESGAASSSAAAAAEGPGSGAERSGEEQSSAKKARVEQIDPKSFEFDMKNPMIPCPRCGDNVSLAFTKCPSCHVSWFREPKASLTERKQIAGFVAELKLTNRGPRSDRGNLRQSLKGHRKYGRHKNPHTGQPYTSLLERFDFDVIYRFRMLSNGWSRDTIPLLQNFLETPLLEKEQATRTRSQIESAYHFYVANPDLDESNELANWKASPDWKRVRAARDQFHQGRAQHQQNAPVIPWVARTLERDFGYTGVLTEEDPAPGEARASASSSGPEQGAEGGDPSDLSEEQKAKLLKEKRYDASANKFVLVEAAAAAAPTMGAGRGWKPSLAPAPEADSVRSEVAWTGWHGSEWRSWSDWRPSPWWQWSNAPTSWKWWESSRNW